MGRHKQYTRKRMAKVGEQLATNERSRLAPTPRNDITSREKEILELLAQGWTARETARRVELSVRTVERHIDNLRLKMNAHNAAHLVACAFSRGMLKAVGGVAKIAS